MANIVKRGKKGAPRFYVQFVVGRTADGKRLQRMHLLKGVETLPQAKQELVPGHSGFDRLPEAG